MKPTPLPLSLPLSALDTTSNPTSNPPTSPSALPASPSATPQPGPPSSPFPTHTNPKSNPSAKTPILDILAMAVRLRTSIRRIVAGILVRPSSHIPHFPISRRKKLSFYITALIILLSLSFFLDLHRAAASRSRKAAVGAVQLAIPPPPPASALLRPADVPIPFEHSPAAISPQPAEQQHQQILQAQPDVHTPSDTREAYSEDNNNTLHHQSNNFNHSSILHDPPVDNTQHVPASEDHGNQSPIRPVPEHGHPRSDISPSDSHFNDHHPDIADSERRQQKNGPHPQLLGRPTDTSAESANPRYQSLRPDHPLSLAANGLSPEQLNEEVAQLIAHVEEETSSHSGPNHMSQPDIPHPDDDTTEHSVRDDRERADRSDLNETQAVQLDVHDSSRGASARSDSVFPAESLTINVDLASKAKSQLSATIGSIDYDSSVNWLLDNLPSRLRNFWKRSNSSTTSLSSHTKDQNANDTDAQWGKFHDTESEPDSDNTTSKFASVGLPSRSESVETSFEDIQKQVDSLLKRDRQFREREESSVLVLQALGLQATRGDCEGSISGAGGSLFKSDAEAASMVDVERSEPLWGAWCMFKGTQTADAMSDYLTMAKLFLSRAEYVKTATTEYGETENGHVDDITTEPKWISNSSSDGALSNSSAIVLSLDDVLTREVQDELSEKLRRLRVHLSDSELRYIGALSLQASFGNCSLYRKERRERASGFASGSREVVLPGEVRVLTEPLTEQTADRHEGALWGAWCVLHGKSRSGAAFELSERVEQLEQIAKTQVDEQVNPSYQETNEGRANGWSDTADS